MVNTSCPLLQVECFCDLSPEDKMVQADRSSPPQVLKQTLPFSICWSVNKITVGKSLQTTSRMKPGKTAFCNSITVARGSLEPSEFLVSSVFLNYFICLSFLGNIPRFFAPRTPPTSLTVLNKALFGPLST